MKTDWEFFVDQLVNAWEYCSPDEMVEHISSQCSNMNHNEIKKLVDIWYNLNPKTRMELNTMDSFISFMGLAL